MNEKRLFPLSGVAFVGLVILAVVGFGGSTPGSGASGADLAAFYGGGPWRQFTATFLLAASVPFLILFGVSLAGTFSAGRGGRTAWEIVLMAGTVLTAGTVLIVAFVHLALVDGGDQGISRGGLEALNALDNNTWVAFSAAFGVMMLGAAGLSITQAGAYRWLGRGALVLSTALFVPFADFFALILTAIWIVLVSVTMSLGAGSTKRSELPRDIGAPVTTNP